MATHGRLAARYTVPVGGWSAALTEVAGAGGPLAVTVPAGDYWNGDLAAALATALSAAGGTYTSAVGLGEDGTGKTTLTLTAGATSWSLTWTDTELRDALGYTGSIPNTNANIAVVGTNQHEGIWLPDGVWSALNGGGGNWAGVDELDLRAQESPAGDVFSLAGQMKTVLDQISWTGLSRAKVWLANESTTNESLQKFYRDAIAARAPWALTSCGPIRWYPDAGDTDYAEYKCPTWNRFTAIQMQQNWTGRWRVELSRLVEVP